ncbi:MAG: sensor histidine kinase [Eubacteriaceae bacterium]|jgi:K+-sensing histidine kinase KdpD
MPDKKDGYRYWLVQLALMMCWLGAATIIGYLFRELGFPETNIVLLYVLAVMCTARFSSEEFSGILASVLAAAAVNYFFTQPYFTLAVDDPSYYITFAVMTVTSVITSTLTGQVRRITEQESKARELAAQERYRGTLLRSISHDLRTPLSGIMGTAEMIAEMSDPEDPRTEMAQGIWKDADWLHTLVENILNLTRLEDGRLALNKEPEAAEEIIGSAIAHIEKRAPDRDITADFPDELLLVPMDGKLIVQVLINLMDNAVKHTTPGQEIRVAAVRKGNNAEFSVSDEGSGISDDDLPKIFDMFYTTAAGLNDVNRGVGLGLPICSEIVKAHGGTIRAEQRKSGGARFLFTLPLTGEKND